MPQDTLITNTEATPNTTGKVAGYGSTSATATNDFSCKKSESGESHIVEVRQSLQENTPSKPLLLGGNGSAATSIPQSPVFADSPARHSHDSSMNYHRQSESKEDPRGSNGGDYVPLRDSNLDKQNGGDDNNDGENRQQYGGSSGGDPNNLYTEDASLIQPSPTKDSDGTDGNSPGDDVPEAPLENHKRTNQLFKRAIFATIPVFMAYASMITLQRSIKEKIGITNEQKDESDLFGVAVGNLYLGNLIFRLLHNVLFSFLIPRHRTMLSYTVLCLSHLIVGFAYWVFNSKSLAWTFIAYLLAGVGIGTFESNVLSCLSPLGHGTKSWAVIGIPIGFNGVSVGFYIMFAIEPHLEWLKGFPYFFIAVCNILGLGFFIYGLPYVEYEASHDNVVKFKEDVCRWAEWFPRVKHYCFALCADMFCVSMFSAIVYYIYNVNEIPIVPYSEKTIPKNIFQVWYNFCSFLGDFTGRKLAYRDKHRRNPYYFLIFSLIGIVLILSKVVLLAPFGMFCIMFANGSIYAHTTKHIDNVVDDRFILIALSVWLFVGDVGSYTASLIVQPLQIAIGPVPEPFFPPDYNNTLPGWWGNVTDYPTMTTASTTTVSP